MKKNICLCKADLNYAKLIPFITKGKMFIECPICKYIWLIKNSGEFIELIKENKMQNIDRINKK